MTVSPRDPVINNTLIVTFKSNSLAVADRVNGLDSLVSTDTSAIVSHNYTLAYDEPVSGKNLHCVQVVYTMGNEDGTDINGARIFNIVVPEDADVCYYVDPGNKDIHA